MLFAEVVATSALVASTSGRSAKSEALADLLRRLAADEIEPTIGFLTGEPRQGRIGVGWRTVVGADLPTGDAEADEATLTIGEIDRAISELSGLSGAGSVGAKRTLLQALLGQGTAPEVAFFTELLGGGLRQGALAGVMTDAVAKASGVPATVVRRAIMLGGRLDGVARLALTEGRPAVEAVHLEVGRGLQPMLASTAASATDAIEQLGQATVEWKLDGIRLQAHRDGDEVVLYTRNLNDITARLPQVVEIVRGLPATSLVLDGEALTVDTSGRPMLFQDSARSIRSDADGSEGDDGTTGVRPFFFDVMHLDGEDLIDVPMGERRARLEAVAGPWCIPGTITDDPAAAEAVLADALAAGHEGVVVKGIESTYEAGRRGKAWRKVKPVHTLDLVVVGVEWGHGRRTGWLSNLHLGARAPDGSFVMVGKTFKGLTDDLLRWQTERFQALAIGEETWGKPQTGIVWVRPEQVVEIAVDGVQRSTRYPGGVALRFARVVRYRDDKDATEADEIASVQGMLADTR